MRTVHKYTLELTNIQEISISIHAKFMHFNMQHGKPTIWLEIDSIQATELKSFYIIGTGHKVPEYTTYLGTCFDGSFVWHLYKEM